jgi:hypothetical protein
MEPVLGEPVLEQVKDMRLKLCPVLIRKTTDKDSWRKELYEEMMFQLETWPDLKAPKLKFPRLKLEDPEKHMTRYNMYFEVSTDSYALSNRGSDMDMTDEDLQVPPQDPEQKIRDKLQKKLVKEFARIKEVLLE